MAATTSSKRRACWYTPPSAEGRGRSSQPPLTNARATIEVRATQRARGNDFIMAHGSRTMREGLPDATSMEERRRGETSESRMQQKKGRRGLSCLGAPGQPAGEGRGQG